MTSTSRETRREEYSSNVIRSLQPSRPLSPYSQKSDFDNNLGKFCSIFSFDEHHYEDR